MSAVLYIILAGVAGFVAGVFVYRNNAKDFGPIADKIDNLYDKVEDLAEKLKDKVDK